MKKLVTFVRSVTMEIDLPDSIESVDDLSPAQENEIFTQHGKEIEIALNSEPAIVTDVRDRE